MNRSAGGVSGGKEKPGGDGRAVGTDSVDELSAAYGDQGAEGRDAGPLKQAPES